MYGSMSAVALCMQNNKHACSSYTCDRHPSLYSTTHECCVLSFPPIHSTLHQLTAVSPMGTSATPSPSAWYNFHSASIMCVT
eukprot:m.125778 g.125778  ORF g.125778 m.125778 type:complete len:82 (-) comp13811_c0_seq4:1558-1803(-)